MIPWNQQRPDPRLYYFAVPNAIFDDGINAVEYAIIYTSREGREQYNYEITQDIYNRLGTFRDDVENERLIHTAKRTYSFENTMYGTLGPERVVWDEEANEAMRKAVQKHNKKKRATVF